MPTPVEPNPYAPPATPPTPEGGGIEVAHAIPLRVTATANASHLWLTTTVEVWVNDREVLRSGSGFGASSTRAKFTHEGRDHTVMCHRRGGILLAVQFILVVDGVATGRRTMWPGNWPLSLLAHLVLAFLLVAAMTAGARP